MKKKDSLGRIILGNSYDALDKAIKQSKGSSFKIKKQFVDYKTAAASLIEQNRQLIFELLKKGKL